MRFILDASWHAKSNRRQCKNEERAVVSPAVCFRAVTVTKVTVTVITQQLTCGCCQDPKNQEYQIFRHLKL